jgi:hypothetical protein
MSAYWYFLKELWFREWQRTGIGENLIASSICPFFRLRVLHAPATNFICESLSGVKPEGFLLVWLKVSMAARSPLSSIFKSPSNVERTPSQIRELFRGACHIDYTSDNQLVCITYINDILSSIQSGLEVERSGFK